MDPEEIDRERKAEKKKKVVCSEAFHQWDCCWFNSIVSFIIIYSK